MRLFTGTSIVRTLFTAMNMAREMSSLFVAVGDMQEIN